jgi:iron complex transport system substrate-binding protein
LKPDLVLVWGRGRASARRTSCALVGWPVYEIEIRDVAGLVATLRKLRRRTLGTATGGADAPREPSRPIGRRLQARYAGRRPVRVFFQLWDAPPMTLNGQHIVSSAIYGLRRPQRRSRRCHADAPR